MLSTIVIIHFSRVVQSSVLLSIVCLFAHSFRFSNFRKFLMLSSYGKICFENYIVCPTHLDTIGVPYALKYCVLWIIHFTLQQSTHNLLYVSHFICEMCENCPIPTILCVCVCFFFLNRKCHVYVGRVQNF